MLPSTAQLVAASDGSLSVASSVGGQSLSIGKPHAYLSAARHDVFTDSGLIPVAPNISSLVATLNGTFRAENFTVSADAMAIAGVPLNGTANQEARLRQLLQ